MGLSETDVIEINAIVSSYGFDYYNITKDMLNKQSLIKDLYAYRNIKLAIRENEIKKSQLSSRITELENQKANLESYLNFLILIIYKFGDLQQSLIKKGSLEKPPLIFICLLYNCIIDKDKNLSVKNDDSKKDQDQNEKNDNQDQNNEIDQKEF